MYLIRSKWYKEKKMFLIFLATSELKVWLFTHAMIYGFYEFVNFRVTDLCQPTIYS